MESALEEIEFLARSSNRVELLRLLAEGRQTRRHLGEATGASQATLGRILGDFEERHWVRREGDTYVATATGQLVVEEFVDLLAVLETEGRLREVVPHLPTDAVGFDLRHLAGATITRPTATRPNAPIQRLLDLLADAKRVRVFSHALNEQSLAVFERRTTEGALRFEAVVSRAAIDALAADSELQRRLLSLFDAPRASVRVRNDPVPLAVTIADDVVHLLVRDGNGVLQASVDTDSPAVRAWATETFDGYWKHARPLERRDVASG